MLFPITPSEFWKQIRIAMDEIVSENLSQQYRAIATSHIPGKALLKSADVCEIFPVSKPSL
jgi:hypothetical protein